MFLVNFQDFQAELSTEEECRVNSTKVKHFHIFFRRFLRLKAHAPEVFNEQVITEAIKALHIGPLHSYLVQEHPRTLEELYDNFRKFNRPEVLHFRKQDQ
jgi:hypothetical protein